MIEVIEDLIGKGYDLHMIDKNSWPAWSAPIEISSSITFRTISRLMVNRVDAILEHAQTVVIGNKDPTFEAVAERLHDGQHLVDFVRITNRRSENARYDGICW